MKSSFSSNYYFNLLAINAEKNEKDFDDSKVENIQNQKSNQSKGNLKNKNKITGRSSLKK